MLSRRRLLRRSLYTAAGLTLKRGVPAFGQAMASPASFRSAVKLTRYVDALPVPPVIRPTGNVDEVIAIANLGQQSKRVSEITGETVEPT